MAVSPEVIEKIPSEEITKLNRGGNIGLQGRLLIGHAFLEPSKAFGKDITAADLLIDNQKFIPAEALSTLERTHTWRDRLGNNHEAQKQLWADAVVKAVARKRDYFNADEGKRYKNLYQKLGIDIDDFNHEKAISIYGHFFAPERRGKEVKGFVNDILALEDYRNATNPATIDFAKVKGDLEAYDWLGTMFGNGSALLISELLSAEARMSTDLDKEQLTEELNSKVGSIFNLKKKRRIDKLNDIEIGLLTYTNLAFQKGELKIPEALKPFMQQRIVDLPEGGDRLPVAPPLPPVPVSSTEDEDDGVSASPAP